MKLFSLLFACFALTVLILLTALHTPFNLPLTQLALEKFTNYRLNAQKMQYSLLEPLTIKFIRPQLAMVGQVGDYSVQQLALTFSPLSTIYQKKLILKQLSIDGVTLHEQIHRQFPFEFGAEYLQLRNADLQLSDFKISGAALDLQNWHNSYDAWGKWSGDFIFSAKRVNYADEEIKHAQLAGNQSNGSWIINLLSFKSQYGDISAALLLESNKMQFEQFTLANATIEGVQRNAFKVLEKNFQPWLDKYEIAINKLNLFDINVYTTDLTVEHLSLSGANLALSQGKVRWQVEPLAEFSFNADLVSSEHWVLSDLVADFTIDNKQLTVKAFSSDLMDDALLTFSGQFSEKSSRFSNLAISNLTLDISRRDEGLLLQWWEKSEQLQIDNLAIYNSHFTSVSEDNAFFFNKVNVDGEALLLKKGKKPALWQGKLQASAADATINQISLRAPLVTSENREGDWLLQAVLPFTKGHLELDARLALQEKGQPWQLSAQGLALPSEIYQQWSIAALPLKGEHDLNLQLSGLASSSDALRYSISGELTAAPIVTFIALPPFLNAQNEVMPAFSLANLPDLLLNKIIGKNQQIEQDLYRVRSDDIKLTADRGRVFLAESKIENEQGSIILSGQWDLVKKSGGFSAKKE
ncbi:MAG: AsmA family protein [Vibrionaceae bacterium]